MIVGFFTGLNRIDCTDILARLCRNQNTWLKKQPPKSPFTKEDFGVPP